MRDTRKLDVMHLVQTFTNNVAYLFFTITRKARFSQTSKLCLYHRPGFNVMCLLQNRGTTEEVTAGHTHRLSYKSSQCAFVCLDLVSV